MPRPPLNPITIIPLLTILIPILSQAQPTRHVARPFINHLPFRPARRPSTDWWTGKLSSSSRDRTWPVRARSNRLPQQWQTECNVVNLIKISSIHPRPRRPSLIRSTITNSSRRRRPIRPQFNILPPIRARTRPRQSSAVCSAARWVTARVLWPIILDILRPPPRTSFPMISPVRRQVTYLNLLLAYPVRTPGTIVRTAETRHLCVPLDGVVTK